MQLADLGHQRFVDAPGGRRCRRAARRSSACCAWSSAALRDVAAACRSRSTGTTRRRPAASPSSAARSPPGGRRRPRPSAPSSCASRSGAWPAWRWSWSCRRPAGRPSGSPPAAASPGRCRRRPRPSSRASSRLTMPTSAWPGVSEPTTSGAERLVLDAGDEVAHHRQRDVGFEQGHAHFAQHVLHVVFGDAGLAAHRLDEAAAGGR